MPLHLRQSRGIGERAPGLGNILFAPISQGNVIIRRVIQQIEFNPRGTVLGNILDSTKVGVLRRSRSAVSARKSAGQNEKPRVIVGSRQKTSFSSCAAFGATNVGLFIVLEYETYAGAGRIPLVNKETDVQPERAGLARVVLLVKIYSLGRTHLRYRYFLV